MRGVTTGDVDHVRTVHQQAKRRGAPPGAPIRIDLQTTLTLGVNLGRRGLELEADEGLVADHPSIVARLDHVRLACPDLALGAVLVQ
jgi:hypothetical protein